MINIRRARYANRGDAQPRPVRSGSEISTLGATGSRPLEAVTLIIGLPF